MLSTCMALMQLREDKDLVEMEFCVPGRAKLIVHNSFVTDPKIPFAAFAVPCSPTSNSWHYTSKKGRRQIAKEASVGRLVFIFRVDEAVGVDLSKLNVSQDFSLLMPTNLNSSTYKTPVLSTQEKLFESKEVYRSESGTAVVHDLTYIGSAQKFRRLTFEDSLAQTEMRIGANKSVVYDADAKGYIQVMSWLIKVVAKASSTLIIGLGGGELCHGITYENPECKMIAIDVSTDVIEIAKKCFGLKN